MGKPTVNMGVSMADLHRYQEATDYLNKAYLFFKDYYSDEHNVIGTIFTNMGLINVRTGNLAEAQKNLESALSIYFDYYGTESPQIAIVFNNLGFLMMKKRCWKKLLIIMTNL